MKVPAYLIILFSIMLVFTACSHQSIQGVYRDSGTSVALEEEQRGNLQKAETEFKIAVGRAKMHLGDTEIADSQFQLGAFYRRQNRPADAIFHLQKALSMEESLSGPQSEKCGRILAELAAAFLQEENYFEGRPLATRLEPLAIYYTGNAAIFVEKVLAAYAIDPQKYAQEVAHYKTLADSGDPQAQYDLANVFFDGPEAKQRIPEILHLYQQAAGQGHVGAQYYLGVMYDKGRGVDNDDAIARDWYRTAAENGHPAGQWNYAVFMMQGRGGTKDKREAMVWVKKSAAQGYPSAQRALQVRSQD